MQVASLSHTRSDRPLCSGSGGGSGVVDGWYSAYVRDRYRDWAIKSAVGRLGNLAGVGGQCETRLRLRRVQWLRRAAAYINELA